MKKLNNKKEARTSGFIHIGKIVPNVMRDIERRIKESHKDKKASLGMGCRRGETP